MIPGDLTTLDTVKAWLGASGNDPLLARLITTQSQFIQSWLNRYIALRNYTEVRDGMGEGAGRYTMVFDNYPVSSVQYLSINGVEIKPSADGGVLQPGYGFDSTEIWLASNTIGWNAFSLAGYARGKRNVRVKYTAGFLVMPSLDDPPYECIGLLPAEQQTIPSKPNSNEIKTFYTWLVDNGVSYADTGIPLVKVTGAPAPGQYSVNSAGTYRFNATDAGQSVLLSYSYVPPEIEQACIEMVSLRFKERDRIGVNSKTVGTETISYSQKDMPSDVDTILSQYRKVYSFS